MMNEVMYKVTPKQQVENAYLVVVWLVGLCQINDIRERGNRGHVFLENSMTVGEGNEREGQGQGGGTHKYDDWQREPKPMKTQQRWDNMWN
jgi:hypothetical protein